MRLISLFCGIGGFELGLQQANKGYNCVFANDIDRHACQCYREHFGSGELVEGDIRAIPADSIPDHDLLVGGFPCQPFSIAGKRRGTSDARGTLFGEILRVLEAKRPAKVLLENVPGLLSIEGGETFAQIILALGDLGYFVEWQVLDSQHFGVPQHRERVFIVGHLGGANPPLVANSYRIRRLTPTECERLQGFPDGWTSMLSDTQRYKCLGNAVTVNVIEFLGKRLSRTM